MKITLFTRMTLPALSFLFTSMPIMAENPTSAKAVKPPIANAAGNGGMSVDGVIESRSPTNGGFKFPDGSIQTTAMDATCAAGSSIRRLFPDGSVICETDDAGVTSVAAGSGLAGGPITGSGAISVATGGIQETMLANDAVTSAKISAGAVDTGELKDGAVTPEKLIYPFKASAAVPANQSAPPEDNAVISGINTTPSPGALQTVYGIFGQATDNTNNFNEHESAGVFGRGHGASAYGVKGIAGNITGITTPFGSIGVVGIGQSRGVVGSSDSGTGVYASSDTNYGIWAQSTSYRGVTGRTGRADDNYGLYTPDNLFTKNYNSTGTTSQVFKYTGESNILPGDVVSFSGIQAVGGLDDDPVVTVNSTAALPEAAIAGVAASRFNMDAVRDDDAATRLDPTPAGVIRPGDYVLVVVRGATPVNVDMDASRITPGSLLVSDAEDRTIDAVSPNRYSPTAAAPSTGQTIGVVLGELALPAKKGDRSAQEAARPRQVYVYVSPR